MFIIITQWQISCHLLDQTLSTSRTFKAQLHVETGHHEYKHHLNKWSNHGKASWVRHWDWYVDTGSMIPTKNGGTQCPYSTNWAIFTNNKKSNSYLNEKNKFKNYLKLFRGEIHLICESFATITSIQFHLFCFLFRKFQSHLAWHQGEFQISSGTLAAVWEPLK